jgi:hypothetical protein
LICIFLKKFGTAKPWSGFISLYNMPPPLPNTGVNTFGNEAQSITKKEIGYN